MEEKNELINWNNWKMNILVISFTLTINPLPTPLNQNAKAYRLEENIQLKSLPQKEVKAGPELHFSPVPSYGCSFKNHINDRLSIL